MREIAPYGLRLTPKLKQRLEESAQAGGRSLQKEIVMRLENSLLPGNGHAINQKVSPYTLELSELEGEMLRLFRDWPSEKQLGFLTLFK